MKFTICIIFLILGTSLATSFTLKKRTSLISYGDIPDCQNLAGNTNQITGFYKSYYDTQMKSSKCPQKDVYTYTTDFYKVINCYLRTNLSEKLKMPAYVEQSIKTLRKNLSDKAPVNGKIFDLPKGVKFIEIVKFLM